MQASTPSRTFSPESILLFFIAAAYVLWIMSLPLFPTQDGPIHLYYVSIMRQVLFGHVSAYSRYFYIKHLLPPYSLYYYSLLLLSRVVPLLVADKLIVSLYVVSFLYGFRFLARLAGPSADRMSLLASFLLLNWPLMMGFVNFCLSLTFALWALGWWFRATGKPDHRARILFVAFGLLIVFTHPVPLLLLVLVCGADLARRAYRRHCTPLTREFFFDAATFASTFVFLGYVKLFTSKAVLHQLAAPATGIGRFVHRLKWPGAFAGAGWASILYELGILCAFLVPVILARAELKRSDPKQASSPVRLLLWIAIACALVLPFIPHDLNGSHFFADRLALVAWLAALLAGSACSARDRLERPLWFSFVAAFAVLVLILANQRIRPIANAIAAIETTPQADVGEVGISLQGFDYAQKPTGLSYDPFLWAAASYFRHNDAVLYNIPWLDLEIIPIGPQPPLANRVFPSATLEAPWLVRPTLIASPAAKSAVTQQARFAFVTTANFASTSTAASPSADPLCAGAKVNPAAAPASWYYVCDGLTPAK